MKKRRSKSYYPKPFKSYYEYQISIDLTKRGIEWEYEGTKYTYHLTTRRGFCPDCGSKGTKEAHTYTPDWYLPDSDIVIESKGRFTGKDRNIQKAMLEEHPELNIKMLFLYDNKLSKSSKTKYSQWCDKYEIDYHVSKEGIIPERWLK